MGLKVTTCFWPLYSFYPSSFHHKDSDDNGKCLRATGIQFSDVVRVHIGDGLLVFCNGKQRLCIMKGALKMEIADTSYSFVTVDMCLPSSDEQPYLSEIYSPMPILHRYPAFTLEDLPSLVTLDDILELVHLPHACLFREYEGIFPCWIENGELHHRPENQYVVHNTLLVPHAEYKVNSITNNL